MLPIIINTDNVVLTESLESFINKKFANLTKYYKDIIKLRVTLSKLSAASKGMIFKVSLDAEIPGNDLHFEEETEEINKALSNGKDVLVRLLKKSKEKNKDKQKREIA